MRVVVDLMTHPLSRCYIPILFYTAYCELIHIFGSKRRIIMWISCLILLLVDIGNVQQVQSFSFTGIGSPHTRTNQQQQRWLQRIRAGEYDHEQLTGAHSSALHATATSVSSTETTTTATRSPFTMLINNVRMFFKGIWRMLRGTVVQRTDPELKSGIAKFYDESSQIWLDVWGEHMHHGYYPDPKYSDHIQVRL